MSPRTARLPRFRGSPAASALVLGILLLGLPVLPARAGHGDDAGSAPLYRSLVEEPSRWDRDDGRGSLVYQLRGRLRASVRMYVGRERVRHAVLHLNDRPVFRIDDRVRQRRGYFEAFEDKRLRELRHSSACVTDVFVRIHFRGGNSLDYAVPARFIRGYSLAPCDALETERPEPALCS